MPAVSNVIIRNACSWHAASAAAPSSAAVRATNEMTYEVAESRFDTARKVMSFKKKMRFAGKHTQLKSTKSAPTIERSEAAKAVVMTVSSSGVSPVKLESELARAVAGSADHSQGGGMTVSSSGVAVAGAADVMLDLRPDVAMLFTARVVHGSARDGTRPGALPRPRHRLLPRPLRRRRGRAAPAQNRASRRQGVKIARAPRDRAPRRGSRSDFTVGCRGWLSQPDRTEILLDYLPGGCLNTLLERNGALSASSARFYVACAAAALEFLHARDLVHRDVKPSNLVVDAAGYARLVDFGFARRLAPGERSVSLLGTPEYLAPEIFLNEGHAAPVDLYALGATLHELLTDTHPFTGDDPQQVYAAALRGELLWPHPSLEAAPPPSSSAAAGARARGARRRRASSTTPLSPRAPAVNRSRSRRWTLMQSRHAVPPPFVPRLRSPLDASHFDPPDDEDAAAAAVVEARERIGAAANWRAPAEAEADEPGCGIT